LTDAPVPPRPRLVALRLVAAIGLLLAEAAVCVAALFPRVSADYRAYFIDHTSRVCPPCHPTTDYVELENPIEFGGLDHDGACVLLGEGWSYPESWGIWNVGNRARIALPYAPDQNEALLSLIAHAQRKKSQHIEIAVDGADIGRFLIPAGGASVAVPLPPTDRPRVATIMLRVDGAFRPQDAGESLDARKLGVGLVKIERRRREAAPPSPAPLPAAPP